MGSVSIQVWGIACASVVGMAGSAAVASYALAQGKSAPEKKEAVEIDGRGEKKDR